MFGVNEHNPIKVGAPVNVATVPAGERMVVVGKMLASSGKALLTSIKVSERTSSDLIKAAGVNKDIAGRFLAAIGKRDPVAVAYYMPGVDSLRRISRGAKRPENAEAVRSFDAAVESYEAFLRDVLGGRHALDALASAWLPEARERFESASRQMAYRASANLRGVECQTILNSTLIHPGKDPNRFDAAQISGFMNLRRLKPTVPLTLATFDHRDDTSGLPTLTIDGRPIPNDGSIEEFLPQFGTCDVSALRVLHTGKASFYQLVDQNLGVETASDMVFGQFSQRMFRRWARHEGDISANMESVEVPAQQLVLDVLVHKDVWPNIEPEMMVYNTGTRGTALPYDRTRDVDRVDLLDSVRNLGWGIDCCRVAAVPRYLDLLRWTCEQRGWNPDEFRVYHCDSRYPPVGMQFTIAFHLEQERAP